MHFYSTKLGHLVRLMPARLSESSTLSAKEKYADAREAEGAERTTVAKELRSWETALRYGKRKKLVRVDLDEERAEYKDPYKPRKRALAPWELVLLSMYFCRHEYTSGKGAVRVVEAGHRAATIAFVVATGARWGEVMRTRAEDIHPTHVRLRGTKTALAARDVPRGVEPFETILRWALERAEPGIHLFQRWGSVGHDLQTACLAVGIEPCSPNDLRRTYATWLRAAGVAPNLIGAAMGHTTSRMTERVYGRLTHEALGKLLAEQSGGVVAPEPAQDLRATVRALLDTHGREALTAAISAALGVGNVSGADDRSDYPALPLTTSEPVKTLDSGCPGTESNRRHGDFQSSSECQDTTAKDVDFDTSCRVCGEYPPTAPASPAVPRTSITVVSTDPRGSPRSTTRGSGGAPQDDAAAVLRDARALLAMVGADLAAANVYRLVGLLRIYEARAERRSGGGAAMQPAGVIPAQDFSPAAASILSPPGNGVAADAEDWRARVCAAGGVTVDELEADLAARRPTTGPAQRFIAIKFVRPLLDLCLERGIEVHP